MKLNITRILDRLTEESITCRQVLIGWPPWAGTEAYERHLRKVLEKTLREELIKQGVKVE